MEFLAWICVFLSFVFLIGAVALFLVQSRRSKATEPAVDQDEENEIPEAPAAIPRGAGRGGLGRMRQRRARTPVAAAAAAGSDTEQGATGGGADDDEDEEADGYYVAQGASKKDSKKKEKAAKREAEAAARDLKKEKQDKHAEARRLREEAREQEEREKEQELEEFRRKQEAEAEDEYQKWKGAFSMDVEGTIEADAAEESQGMLQDFVDYIKKQKCVMLEDLAAEFGMRTQDVVQRVQALDEMGRISGVMDDRGKFIYISPEEMEAVANYIISAGRVSITHLANKSTELIDLEPRATIEDDTAMLNADDTSKPDMLADNGIVVA